MQLLAPLLMLKLAPANLCAHMRVCLAAQEALRIGDQIRARRNSELLGATFGAWRFQVRRCLRVAHCRVPSLVLAAGWCPGSAATVP